ncbi:hypothetical protein [Streptomyces sp.]|uniref:hypothetical protein n=1 Tax=Streptomyces sp. TaxID=1931 RepID=UPI0039C8EB3A
MARAASAITAASFAGISPIPRFFRAHQPAPAQPQRRPAAQPGRARHHPDPRADRPHHEGIYVSRGITEEKIARDAQRYLKSAVCRQIFKVLERTGRNKAGSIKEHTQAA